MGEVSSTHPHTPPGVSFEVTNNIAFGRPLTAPLSRLVTNDEVFDEVAVQMKWEVTVTLADAGGDHKSAGPSEAAVMSSATPRRMLR